jgi:hypothetical protein
VAVFVNGLCVLHTHADTTSRPARKHPKSVCHFPIFTCKSLYSRSGVEGIRTPDLRCAKSDRKRRGCSPPFENSRKMALLHLEAFVSIRRCSCGLVYYWCIWLSAQRQALMKSPSN